MKALGGALALLAASAAACLGAASPAFAVQTDTWGMSAATAKGTYLPEIVHAADGSRVQDLVLVWNRTSSPLTVHLSVLSVTPENNTFGYSPVVRGLASGIVLPAGQVNLGPKQEARILVTVKEPAGSTGNEYAAISGEAKPVQEGALSVQERLAVIVKATPTAAPVGSGVPGAVPPGAVPPGAVPPKSTHHSSVSFPVAFFGSIGAALLLIVLVVFDRERRRKDSEVAAEAARKAILTEAYLASLPPPIAPNTSQTVTLPPKEHLFSL